MLTNLLSLLWFLISAIWDSWCLWAKYIILIANSQIKDHILAWFLIRRRVAITEVLKVYLFWSCHHSFAPDLHSKWNCLKHIAIERSVELRMSSVAQVLVFKKLLFFALFCLLLFNFCAAWCTCSMHGMFPLLHFLI